MLLVLLGACLGVELQGHMVTLVFHIFRDCQIGFQSGYTILIIPGAVYEGSSSSHPCQYLLLSENRIVLNENTKPLKRKKFQLDYVILI